MKMQFKLTCGCVATRMVDEHARRNGEVTVISRIYEKPYTAVNLCSNGHAEYFKITGTNCKEHFPRGVKPNCCEACGSLL